MLPQKKDPGLVRSLHQKKFRASTGLFIAEGKKMVEEAIASDFRIHSVYSSEEEHLPGAEVHHITSREMEKLSLMHTPPGYLAVLHAETFIYSGEKPVLVLDGISDPGNMGTIIRTAEWFGFSIICTDDCVELYNPKVVQATMGSIFRVKTCYMPVPQVIESLQAQKMKIVIADLKGDNLFATHQDDTTAMVIGSESHGIREAFRRVADSKVTIPSFGRAESLNASVAAAVMMAALRSAEYGSVKGGTATGRN